MTELNRTKENPWQLKTAPGTSEYTMHVEERSGIRVLVCTVGSTILLYDARCIDDLHAMLKNEGGWVELGGADEQKPVKEGTVEAWGRSPSNPLGGWYGLKKGLRGRFGVYIPPLMEALGLCELEHNANSNRMRAIWVRPNAGNPPARGERRGSGYLSAMGVRQREAGREEGEMSSPEQATATQLANIEKRTGKTFAQLAQIVRNSGLTKHGEIRELLQRDLGLGHGDANTLAIIAPKSKGSEPVISEAAPADETVNALYTGAKAALRPIHDRLMSHVRELGAFEISPKKTYLSLRRKRQFAMIGPATRTRVEVGLNMKGLPATERLVALPPGGMCNYKVNVTELAAVDDELIGWIRTACEQSA